MRPTNGITTKKYSYLNLVESVRTEKGPRQKFILNLGNLPIDRSQHKALAKRIEEILTGQKLLLEGEDNQEIEEFAQEAAERIFAKKAADIDQQKRVSLCKRIIEVEISYTAVKVPWKSIFAKKKRTFFHLATVSSDLTNTYFEGQCAANPQAAYGR